MANVDYFIKIDGVDGEATDYKNKNSIDVESWSWSESNEGDASMRGGMGAGKVSMGDFNFVMKENKASPKLMEACASGEHIKKAVLTCRKAGKDQQDYLKITLSDLVVSGFSAGGSKGDGLIPVNQVALNFSKIEYEYKEQKTDGTLGGAVKGSWDMKQMKK